MVQLALGTEIETQFNTETDTETQFAQQVAPAVTFKSYIQE